jgi:sugar phosphate isomerase/epimerase
MSFRAVFTAFSQYTTLGEWASLPIITGHPTFPASCCKATVYALIDENGNEIKKEPSKEENEFKFMPLGQGLQNWAPIVEAVKESDVEYVIYEKDQWYDGDEFEDAKTSRDYLKNAFGI